MFTLCFFLSSQVHGLYSRPDLLDTQLELGSSHCSRYDNDPTKCIATAGCNWYNDGVIGSGWCDSSRRRRASGQSDGTDRFFPFSTCRNEGKFETNARNPKEDEKYMDCIFSCDPSTKQGAEQCVEKCLEQMGMTEKCAKCSELRFQCDADSSKKCLGNVEDLKLEKIIECSDQSFQSCYPAFLHCVNGPTIANCANKMVSCVYEGQCKQECGLKKLLGSFLDGDGVSESGACKKCANEKCTPGYKTCIAGSKSNTRLGLSAPASGIASPKAGGFQTHGGEGQPCRWVPLGVFGSKCDFGFTPVYKNTELPDAFGSIHGENFETRTCTCQPRYIPGENGLYRRLDHLEGQAE